MKIETEIYECLPIKIQLILWFG